MKTKNSVHGKEYRCKKSLAEERGPGLGIGEPFPPPEVASGSTVDVGGIALGSGGFTGKVLDFSAS